ncbi:unnamed protein product [Parascedosporium putredinis]|uniref:Catabolite repression protein creC n=1 Tax=Parascedosporium putredinis TaxID=1442378 RepID=A0A9P1H8M5_9PEZI|nr:unnamed protein product [Parascedosporium putredinis]CAI7999962.1 unnamed protein product [Parascedosporium putredinis]
MAGPTATTTRQLIVLPPPPRYPSQAGYGLMNAGLAPVIETNNILSNPTGPEYQFLVGEGMYPVALAMRLPYYAPTVHTLTGSIFRYLRPQGRPSLGYASAAPSEIPNANPNPLATIPQPATSGCKATLVALDVRHAPRFFLGSSNTTISLNGAPESIQEHPNESRYSNELGALSSDEGRGLQPAMPPTTDANKKRKPKNNMTKSNSSFISRVIGNDASHKKLQDRSTDGMFAFANNEYLTKILFTKAHCLCHDVNHVTKASNHLDMIMGFSTGDIIWWEPFSQRYTRINKNGIINTSPVSEIKWIPGSENLFLAAHMDGNLVVYDKEKEDAVFNPNEESAASSGENQKTNPVALWKISNQRINSYAFSPDNRHLAVVSEDGTLRIIDYLKETLLDLFYSYYGGLTCVCWSPDGKYVLTGGQDDLISIWSVPESAIVARCQGHQSWVTAVAFDPWRCDDRNYRFGSVGEDCRLCLWDFNVGMIHRPKPMSVLHRASISSKLTSPLQTTNTKSSARMRADSSTSIDKEEVVGESTNHPVEPRSRTAMLPPVSTKVVDTHPIAWLEFTEDSIITSCKSGHIRTWSRPTDLVA